MHNSPIVRLIAAAAILMQAACGPGEVESPATPSLELTASYDATANQHVFEASTDTISAGWNTVRLVNASPAVHFALLQRLPEGRTVEHSIAEVGPVFQQAMDLINAGQMDSGFAALANLPAWYGEVVMMGGPGLVSPGGTSEVTLELEPGNYAIECYVKSAEGRFHSVMGMMKGLTVTAGRSTAAAPGAATVTMQLTNEGFGIEGTLTPGRHTVAVTFAEPEPPLLGNDVHLVRLTDDVAIAAVTAWMDWSQPGGLVSTHDGVMPFQFLGGTHEMPMGATAYFTVNLEPGRYAWISERSAQTPLYQEFTVEAP
ncbi:MAG: hypothetical protein ABR551_03385 [Gemmatimonadales bacterium]